MKDSTINWKQKGGSSRTEFFSLLLLWGSPTSSSSQVSLRFQIKLSQCKTPQEIHRHCPGTGHMIRGVDYKGWAQSLYTECFKKAGAYEITVEHCSHCKLGSHMYKRKTNKQTKSPCSCHVYFFVNMKSLLQKYGTNKMFWTKPALIVAVSTNSQLQRGWESLGHGKIQ